MTNERKAELYDGLLAHVINFEDDAKICYEVLKEIGFTNAEIYEENIADADTLVFYMTTSGVEEVPEPILDAFYEEWNAGNNELNPVQIICFCENDQKWYTLDNTDNQCDIKSFPTKEKAIEYFSRSNDSDESTCKDDKQERLEELLDKCMGWMREHCSNDEDYIESLTDHVGMTKEELQSYVCLD